MKIKDRNIILLAYIICSVFLLYFIFKPVEKNTYSNKMYVEATYDNLEHFNLHKYNLLDRILTIDSTRMVITYKVIDSGDAQYVLSPKLNKLGIKNKLKKN